MTIRISPNDKGNPPGKLAEVELLFEDGPLAGLKLIGFNIWERRTGGRSVTFPARQYQVNGERRSFSLLRPLTWDGNPQDRLRDLILAAYVEYETAEAARASSVAALTAGGGSFSIPARADICPSRDDAQPHIVADGRCTLCLTPVSTLPAPATPTLLSEPQEATSRKKARR